MTEPGDRAPPLDLDPSEYVEHSPDASPADSRLPGTGEGVGEAAEVETASPGPALPAGWLGDLVQAWFEARATAGVTPEVTLRLHSDALLARAWEAAWTPPRAAAVTAVEALLESLVGLAPRAASWRAVALALGRFVLSIRAAWTAYAAPVGIVRGSTPTLLPVFRRAARAPAADAA